MLPRWWAGMENALGGKVPRQLSWRTLNWNREPHSRLTLMYVFPLAPPLGSYPNLGPVGCVPTCTYPVAGMRWASPFEWLYTIGLGGFELACVTIGRALNWLDYRVHRLDWLVGNVVWAGGR